MNPDNAPPPRLTMSGVTLSRGERVLFRELSASVPAGGLLELRGPNGAGKTSLLLAIAGVVRPQAGTIAYLGPDGTTDLRPQAHVLLAHNALKPRLTVGENLSFWRTLNGPSGVALEPALERVGLGGLESIEAGHLSTGQMRRLALARLLVTHRTLWLLDEPTAALDSDGETLVAAMLAEHCGAAGIAIVATHHDLRLPDTGYSTRIMIRDGAAALEELRA